MWREVFDCDPNRKSAATRSAGTKRMTVVARTMHFHSIV
jgi:hypothetical protein